MTKIFIKYLLFVVACSAFFSCIKKKGVSPDEDKGFNIIGEWKLTGVQGVIDSTITINNVPYTTYFKTTYDSVAMEATQTINDDLYAKYPYTLTIKMNSDNSDVVSELITLKNAKGVPTPYGFTIYNTWNYNTTKTEADGLIIRGFENTTVLGTSKLNPAQGSTKYIQNLLTHPFFTAYDGKNGHLILYLHVVYTGNPDTPDGNGGFYNPYVSITADYELTFSKK